MSAMRQKKCIFGRFSPFSGFAVLSWSRTFRPWFWVWSRFPLFGAFSGQTRRFLRCFTLSGIVLFPRDFDLFASFWPVVAFLSPVVAPCLCPVRPLSVPCLPLIFVSPASPHQKIKNFYPILYFRFGILAKMQNKTLPFSPISCNGCAFSAA